MWSTVRSSVAPHAEHHGCAAFACAASLRHAGPYPRSAAVPRRRLVLAPLTCAAAAACRRAAVKAGLHFFLLAAFTAFTWAFAAATAFATFGCGLSSPISSVE